MIANAHDIYEHLPADLQDKVWTLVLDAYRNDHKQITNNAYPFRYYTREMHIAAISSIYRNNRGLGLYRAVREYYQDLCDRGYLVVREVNGRRTNWHEMVLFPFGDARVYAKPCFDRNTELISTVVSDDVGLLWDSEYYLDNMDSDDEDDIPQRYITNKWYDVSDDTVYRSEIPYCSTAEYDTEIIYQWVQCYGTDEDMNLYSEDEYDYEHALYAKIPLRVRWNQITTEVL